MTLFDCEVKIIAEIVGQGVDVTVHHSAAFGDNGALYVGSQSLQLLQIHELTQVEISDPDDTEGVVKEACAGKAREILLDQLPAKWTISATTGSEHGHCFRGEAWVPCTQDEGDPFESWAFPIHITVEGSTAPHFERADVGGEGLLFRFYLIVQSV